MYVRERWRTKEPLHLIYVVYNFQKTIKVIYICYLKTVNIYFIYWQHKQIDLMIKETKGWSWIRLNTANKYYTIWIVCIYICSFNANDNLMHLNEQKQKDIRDELIHIQMMDNKEWPRNGNDVTNIHYSDFGVTDNNDIILVLLFR